MNTDDLYLQGLHDGERFANERYLWAGVIVGLMLAAAIVVAVALTTGGGIL